MSTTKKLSNITQAQISGKGVQALADRPNTSQQYGASGLSPAQLKLWFDKLATFLAGKINELQNALSGDYAAAYIRLLLDDKGIENLDDLIKSFSSGEFAEKVIQVYPSASNPNAVPIQTVINSIAQSLSEDANDIEKLQKGSVASMKVELDTSTYTLTIRLFNEAGEVLKVHSIEQYAPPKFRISATNEWEVSNDGGYSWINLGVKATGHQFVTFYKDYGTIEEMNAAVEAQIDDGVPENGLVMIQRDDTSVDGGDATGRVYRKVISNGTYSYTYMGDLSGLQGPMGPKPVKGTDYWTEADKAEIKKYVDDAILGGAW